MGAPAWRRLTLGAADGPAAPHERESLCGSQGLAAQPNWEGTKIMNFGNSGVLGLLILIGDIWAIINIFQSSASNEKKLIWIIAVVLLPVLGLLLWFFLGPRDRGV